MLFWGDLCAEIFIGIIQLEMQRDGYLQSLPILKQEMLFFSVSTEILLKS